MTMPNVKEMFYILYVQKLKSTSVLCFKMTLGLKEYSAIIVFIPPQSHLTASWAAQNSCERNMKWIVVSVWFGKINGLFMYVYLVNGPWNIIYFGTLKSCEESNLNILYSHQKLNGGTYQVKYGCWSRVIFFFFLSKQQNQQQILFKLQ